jgi:fructosamine-3-kinase
MANERGELPAPLVRALDRIADRCGELAGPVEPPARLHGDLWSGNLLLDRSGAPVLIDPAVYGGHREIDLAMMRLFGGFSARAFAAYDEAYPLAPGHAERVAFNQLVPLLVHVILFGAGYRERLAEAVRRYAPVR